MIERFEAESGQSFAEFFTKIVHQREICVGQVSACERKLNKRMRGYDLIMNGQSKIPEPAWREISKTALLRTLIDLVETTGLKPHNGISPATQHYILLIFVDRASFDADPEGYLYPQIILPQFGDVEWREHIFRRFLSSDIPCMVLSKDFDEGAIGDAHIWIKNDIPNELVTKCIAEEFFNSFGLDEGDDVPSIFDWPLSDISERNGLSSLHLLLLKLLYLPEFEPGQSKEETLQDIQHILSR